MSPSQLFDDKLFEYRPAKVAEGPIDDVLVASKRKGASNVVAM